MFVDRGLRVLLAQIGGGSTSMSQNLLLLCGYVFIIDCRRLKDQRYGVTLILLVYCVVNKWSLAAISFLLCSLSSQARARIVSDLLQLGIENFHSVYIVSRVAAYG